MGMGHEFNGLRFQYARSVVEALVPEHQGEPHVVSDGGDEAASSGRPIGRIAVGDFDFDEIAVFILRVDGGHVPSTGLRRKKAGGGHAERFEDAFCEEGVVGFLRGHFDHTGENVGRPAVPPARSGLFVEWGGQDAVDPVFQ